MAEDRKTTASGAGQSGRDADTSGLREDYERAKEGVREEWREAKSHLSDAAQRVREEASQSGSSIASSVERELDRRRDDMAHGLHDLAGSLHKVAREGEGRLPGGLVERAADTLDDVAGTLERQSLHDLADRVGDYGREHPVAFVAGAMLAGFAAGRFLTASSGEGRGRGGQGFADADRAFDRRRGGGDERPRGGGGMAATLSAAGPRSASDPSPASGGGGVSRGHGQGGLPAGSGRGVEGDVTGRSTSPANAQQGQGEPGKLGGEPRSSGGLPEQQPGGTTSVKPQPGVPLPDPKAGSGLGGASAPRSGGFDDPQKKGS